MLVTPWLSLLRSGPDPCDPSERPDRPAGRRDPRRNARTAFRSNPFCPPTRVRTSRGTRLRPSELRWLVRQRQF